MYKNNNSHEAIPVERKLETLFFMSVVILKFIDIDIENFFENIHDLRANI